jgi:hypothetical protein
VLVVVVVVVVVDYFVIDSVRQLLDTPSYRKWSSPYAMKMYVNYHKANSFGTLFNPLFNGYRKHFRGCKAART